MKKSHLFEILKSFDAELFEYREWSLPKSYSSVDEEYRAARQAVVLMDRPYCGHLRVSGADHVDLLHRMTTNELRTLKDGQGQLNVFTNEKGRIVERVTLQKSESEIRLTTSFENTDKLAGWIDKYTFIEDVAIEDLSAELANVTIFGPRGPELLEVLLGEDFTRLPDRHFRDVSWRNSEVRVSRTDETGLSGFDLVVETASLVELWQTLTQQGANFGVRPLGEAAFDVLRIEAGWPLPGQDFDDQINPHEAGMLPYLNFDKGCYIGQEVVARLDTYEKVQKYLVGLVLAGTNLPDRHSKIHIDEKEVGYVTSAVRSPHGPKTMALGYVRTKFISESREVVIHSQGRTIPGKLCKLPFKSQT